MNKKFIVCIVTILIALPEGSGIALAAARRTLSLVPSRSATTCTAVCPDAASQNDDLLSGVQIVPDRIPVSRYEDHSEESTASFDIKHLPSAIKFFFAAKLPPPAEDPSSSATLF